MLFSAGIHAERKWRTDVEKYIFTISSSGGFVTPANNLTVNDIYLLEPT